MENILKQEGLKIQGKQDGLKNSKASRSEDEGGDVEGEMYVSDIAEALEGEMEVSENVQVADNTESKEVHQENLIEVQEGGVK
jgi:hypothetical protein